MLNSIEQGISNGNNNNIAGRDLIVNQLVNNETHVELYEKDIKKIIEIFDEHKALFDRNNPVPISLDDKYDFAEKEKKNQLNNLSDDYFEMMKEDLLPYFYKIDAFLKNPQNKTIKEKYENGSMLLRFWVQANRKQFGTFEEVLMHISDKLVNAACQEKDVDSLTLMVVLNFMYWNCDIGRRK